MSKLEQAARQALEALEVYGEHAKDCPQYPTYTRPQDYPKCDCGFEEAIAALREALAEQDKPLYRKVLREMLDAHEQAEQEPVAKEVLKDCAYFNDIDFEQTPPYLRYDTGDSTAKENWDEYCTIQECLREYGYELTDSDVDHDTVCGDVTRVVEQAEQHKLTEDKISHRKFEQEPVAWLWCKNGKPQSALLHKPTTFPQDSYWQNKGFSAQPLYAAPVRTKDLTDGEIEALWASDGFYRTPTDFARAVIAAYREKNK